MNKPKRIFITGGTGFLGKPLVKLFEKRGHRVLLLARSPEKYKNFFDSSKTQIVKGDLGGLKKWQKYVSDFKPDVAVHLAWQGIPDSSYQTSVHNLEHSLRLFELLASIKCKNVITAGSSWEYGFVSGRVTEDAPINPQNALAAAKDCLHKLGWQLARENNQNFIWLRPFSIYGPGHRRTSLVLHLAERFISGATVDVKNPHAGNDFVYVDDAADAVMLIIDRCQTVGHHVFNLGSGKLVGVAEVANIIYGKKVLKGKSVKGFCADTTRFKKLGWRPKTSIKKGIQKTLSIEFGL